MPKRLRRKDEYLTDGELIRRLRKEKRWTQQNLADQAGCSRGAIQKMEGNPDRHSHKNTIEDVAAALGIPWRTLVAFEPEEWALIDDSLESAPPDKRAIHHKTIPSVRPSCFDQDLSHNALHFHPTHIDPPSDYDKHVLIFTVHDGFLIHPGLYPPYEDNTSDFCRDFHAFYAHERDWGAHSVALSIAYALGLSGYYRFTICRNLLDWGRFGGITTNHRDYFERRALYRPLLSHVQQEKCEEQILSYYDMASSRLKQALEERGIIGKTKSDDTRAPESDRKIAECGLIAIGVHTFDPYVEVDWVRVPRPMTSIVFRPESVQDRDRLRLPEGTYPLLFPSVLVRSTLADGLYQEMHQALCTSSIVDDRGRARGISEDPNFPYLYPDGALEVRLQVYLWLRYLRALFERDCSDHPALREPEYFKVWTGLRNTNQREGHSQEIMNYLLHRMNPNPATDMNRESVLRVYHAIEEYLNNETRGAPEELISKYRVSQFRPSSAVVEIRKDVLWTRKGAEKLKHWPFSPIDSDPPELQAGNSFTIGRAIADGIKRFHEKRVRERKTRRKPE